MRFSTLIAASAVCVSLCSGLVPSPELLEFDNTHRDRVHHYDGVEVHEEKATLSGFVSPMPTGAHKGYHQHLGWNQTKATGADLTRPHETGQSNHAYYHGDHGPPHGTHGNSSIDDHHTLPSTFALQTSISPCPHELAAILSNETTVGNHTWHFCGFEKCHAISEFTSTPIKQLVTMPNVTCYLFEVASQCNGDVTSPKTRTSAVGPHVLDGEHSFKCQGRCAQAAMYCSRDTGAPAPNDAEPTPTTFDVSNPNLIFHWRSGTGTSIPSSSPTEKFTTTMVSTGINYRPTLYTVDPQTTDFIVYAQTDVLSPEFHANARETMVNPAQTLPVRRRGLLGRAERPEIPPRPRSTVRGIPIPSATPSRTMISRASTLPQSATPTATPSQTMISRASTLRATPIPSVTPSQTMIPQASTLRHSETPTACATSGLRPARVVNGTHWITANGNGPAKGGAGSSCPADLELVHGSLSIIPNGEKYTVGTDADWEKLYGQAEPDSRSSLSMIAYFGNVSDNDAIYKYAPVRGMNECYGLGALSNFTGQYGSLLYVHPFRDVNCTVYANPNCRVEMSPGNASVSTNSVTLDWSARAISAGANEIALCQGHGCRDFSYRCLNHTIGPRKFSNQSYPLSNFPIDRRNNFEYPNATKPWFTVAELDRRRTINYTADARNNNSDLNLDYQKYSEFSEFSNMDMLLGNESQVIQGLHMQGGGNYFESTPKSQVIQGLQGGGNYSELTAILHYKKGFRSQNQTTSWIAVGYNATSCIKMNTLPQLRGPNNQTIGELMFVQPPPNMQCMVSNSLYCGRNQGPWKEVVWSERALFRMQQEVFGCHQADCSRTSFQCYR